MHDILITRDSRGKIRIVDISCEWEDALHGFALVRKTSQMGGKITEQPIINIDRGKAGRTVTEQAKLTYNTEGMFSEINSASDSFIFRLEQCFALYPDFLTNVEIEAKVIAALQKAESYIVHLKEQHRQHLLETANSQ